MSRKAIRQVEGLLGRLLERRMSAEHAKDVSSLISRGTWTHDHPLLARDLEALGLPIKIGVGAEERALLELYPQPRGRQSPVEYFPARPARRLGSRRDESGRAARALRSVLPRRFGGKRAERRAKPVAPTPGAVGKLAVSPVATKGVLRVSAPRTTDLSSGIARAGRRPARSDISEENRSGIEWPQPHRGLPRLSSEWPPPHRGPLVSRSVCQWALLDLSPFRG